MANRARVRTQSGLDSLPLPDTTSASTSNTAGTGGNKESSLRRISEQKHLRSFLSVHFNRQEFVKATISGGATDSVFNDLSSAIVDVKEEIQSYITMNKDSLIHGMSNVTVLGMYELYFILQNSSVVYSLARVRVRVNRVCCLLSYYDHDDNGDDDNDNDDEYTNLCLYNLCFLLLPIHILLTFHLLSPSFTISPYYMFY